MPSPPNGLAIDLQDVAKVYKGGVHALQGIEMRVARGEVFGLLGPNGAGKSTLVKIMMTVVRPTRAVGTVLGQPIGHKPTLRHVGYLPENHRFPRYLTGRQTLEFFAALAKVDRPTRRRRAAELLEVVGMSAWADKRVGTYSKGMMQRVGLAQALAPDPDLIVLDEPTDGVDPVGRRDIRDVLQRLRQQGKTVFLNSHLLSELEMVCNRVAILVQGRVARQGTLEELTAKSRRYEIEFEPGSEGISGMSQRIGSAIGVTFTPIERKMPAMRAHFPTATNPGLPPGAMAMGNAVGMVPPGFMGAGMVPPVALSATPPAPLPPLLRGSLSDGVWAELDGAILSIGTADVHRVQPLLDSLRAAGLTIRRLVPVRQSLEDLFMEAVMDPQTGQAFAPGAGQWRQPNVGVRP